MLNISLDNSGKHPLYSVQIKSLSGKVYNSSNRFASFRDIDEMLQKLSTSPIQSPFPETLAKSSFGIALSNQELEDRRFKLEKVNSYYLK